MADIGNFIGGDQVHPCSLDDVAYHPRAMATGRHSLGIGAGQ